MTSEATRLKTQSFFEACGALRERTPPSPLPPPPRARRRFLRLGGAGFFGLLREQVFFFDQGWLPALTPEARLRRPGPCDAREQASIGRRY